MRTLDTKCVSQEPKSWEQQLALVLVLLLLGPLLSASKESLLIVQIDSQLCLIYCCMIYRAAALPVPLRCWLTGRELHSPLPRRKGDAPWIQRGFFCTAAGDHRLPGRGNALTPPHSLQQLKEGPSPDKSLKWKCEYARWKMHSCTPSPCVCTPRTQKKKNH